MGIESTNVNVSQKDFITKRKILENFLKNRFLLIGVVIALEFLFCFVLYVITLKLPSYSLLS